MPSPRLFISGTKMLDRPNSRRTIFADGSPDATARPGVDVELSHWFPNQTPHHLKADTSTEICMNFVASENVDWDVVVNNHVDVDGVLSVFTLLHPETALTHRTTIVSAAEMGDFWGWGEHPAQVLFQGLTEQIDTRTSANADPQEICEECLAYVDALIERRFLDPDVEISLMPLHRSVDWIVSERILRKEHHSRFSAYAVPNELCENRLEMALCIPSFNAAISRDCLVWPQARARWDREKVQLVCFETPEGWYYDLWYPGYMWAETPNSWRAPGLIFSGRTNGYELSNAPLQAAAADLQSREQNNAAWTVETTFSPFSILRRGYPVVLSVMAGDRPTPSSLTPDAVADRLAEVFGL